MSCGQIAIKSKRDYKNPAWREQKHRKGDDRADWPKKDDNIAISKLKAYAIFSIASLTMIWYYFS